MSSTDNFLYVIRKDIKIYLKIDTISCIIKRSQIDDLINFALYFFVFDKLIYQKYM